MSLSYGHSTAQLLNLLWLTENYPPQRGGMAVSCDRIVRSLRSLDVLVDTAHFSTRYKDWGFEKKSKGQHISCPVREDIAHAMNRLWSLIGNNHYTHVVAFGGLLPMISAPVFSAWLNVPLVTMIRGNDFDTGIFSLKRGDVLRQALKASSVICAVSRDKVEKIRALFPQAKIEWTPNGIDLTDWEFTVEDFLSAKNWRDTATENKRVLGLFGQLKRKKGGLFFVENLLRSGYANRFHLLLVGDAEAELIELLETKREEISYSILPFLDRYELLPHYAACDMIVIPSFYDGLPNVLLETSTLGIPALASNVGGMRDILTDNETSILFSAGNEHDCRRAIERSANISLEDLKKLGANAREMVIKNFDQHKEAERYLDIFKESLCTTDC